VCGKTRETTTGWFFRKEKQGRGKVVEIDYCPSCAAKVQQEVEEQSRDANLGGGILLGAVAAALGAAAWYGLVVATDKKYGVAAVGVGFLIGRGVLFGAGNKRSRTLQIVSAALAVVGLAAGEYLTINHLARKFVAGFTGWLTVFQFLTIYRKLLANGDWFLDVFFYLLSLIGAVGQLQPLKLRPRK
jgi:hypothetical protein